jgi:purine-binding chemotaxis protein CheW
MRTQRHGSEPEKLVGFRVGDVAYAVRIGAVKEIINPQPLTELPHAPRSVAGVADHRGTVVPIISVRARFGLPLAPQAGRSKWILVEMEGRTVGLVVDQVTEVFAAAEAELRPAPELGGGEDRRGIAGVTAHQGEMVFVLDLDRFGDLVRAAGEGSRPPREQEQA